MLSRRRTSNLLSSVPPKQPAKCGERQRDPRPLFAASGPCAASKSMVGVRRRRGVLQADPRRVFSARSSVLGVAPEGERVAVELQLASIVRGRP